MVRTLGALVCAALALACAQQPAPQDKDRFVHLLEGNDLSGWEGNGNSRWTLQNGLLTGRSSGKSPAALIWQRRVPSDFETRFEALVNKGAVRIKMRGPGPGPLGIAVQVNPERIEVITNGTPFFIAASNRPGDWKEYRVLFCGPQLKLWINGTPAPYELVAADMPETAWQLALQLSDGEASEVILRNMQIKELKAVHSGPVTQCLALAN